MKKMICMLGVTFAALSAAKASNRNIAAVEPAKLDCSVLANFNYGMTETGVSEFHKKGFKGDFVNADLDQKPRATEFTMYANLVDSEYFAFGTSAKDDPYVMQLIIEDKDANQIWQTQVMSCGHEAKGTDHADYRYAATYACYNRLVKMVPECRKGRLVLE